MAMTVPTEQGVVAKLISEVKDFRDRHLKDEEMIDIHPFQHLDVSTVLQECKVFHDAGFVKMHPKRACHQITKLMWFLIQGETLNAADSIQVFFGVTKLFQSPDGNLRRMVYLFLKEVAESTENSNLIIVTQSLAKDTICDVPLYKGNAIRALSKIVDAGMLGQVERYYKQAIVDRDEFVSSTALLSLLLLSNKPGCADVIARWSNEIQSVLSSSKADMVQFHALALLRSVKKNDKLAVSRIVLTLIKSGMRSPLGLVLLIRYATSLLLSSDSVEATMQSCYSFLESCLHNKSEMVAFEAARALVNHPAAVAAGRDLRPAITVLQVMLTSPRPGQRYGAARTLSRLASLQPAAVAECNKELEMLITDSNRAIGTLAITALLKTGSDVSVDRLIKQITAFMNDVGADELKVVVVQAVHELALRTPAKYRVIMTFLSNALRDEGGYEFKKAILDALLDIMEVIPESKTEGLFHCCEFIEDCEFTALATRVLHLLGKEGPSLAAPQPAQFIRFIYNRVILENAPVRASAVSALAKFATRCEELRPQIIPLLQRCTDDDDDEVRDRAVMSLRLLGANAAYSLELAAASNGGTSADDESGTVSRIASPLSSVDKAISRSLTGGTLPMPISALSKALKMYQARPSAGSFSFSALPHVEIPSSSSATTTSTSSTAIRPDADGGFGYNSEVRAVESAAAAAKIARARTRATAGVDAAGAGPSGSAGAGSGGSTASGSSGGAGSGGAGGGAGTAGGDVDSSAADALYKIPEFASFGALFRSSRPVELTERELEYLVTVQKHIFANHVVLAFTVTNTVPDFLLERVVARVTVSDSQCYKVVSTLSCPRIREGAPGICYTALARNPDAGFPTVTLSTEVRFNTRECDPSKNYEPVGDSSPEEYPVNDVDMTPSDYLVKVPISDFRTAWDAVGTSSEQKEQFQLPFKTVADAVNATFDALGLAPCEGTGAVKAGTNKHMALLAGVFMGGIKVYARMGVSLDAESGCVLMLAVRSEDPAVAELIMSCVA